MLNLFKTGLVLLLLLIASCGHKAPPLPLEKPLPTAPGDFSIRQTGESFLLSWDIPTVNQDGSPLTNLQGFQIYRMEFDPADECPECRDDSVLLAEVDLEYLRGAFRREDRIYLRDGEVAPGSGYRYRVVPVTAGGLAGATAVERRVFLPPAPAPEGLTATGLDSLARLGWEPVSPGEGRELIGYSVYRRVAGEPFPPAPVNSTPLVDTFFENFGLENGTAYVFAVRAVVKSDGLTVESPLSAEAEAIPQSGK